MAGLPSFSQTVVDASECCTYFKHELWHFRFHVVLQGEAVAVQSVLIHVGPALPQALTTQPTFALTGPKNNELYPEFHTDFAPISGIGSCSDIPQIKDFSSGNNHMPYQSRWVYELFEKNTLWLYVDMCYGEGTLKDGRIEHVTTLQ